MFVCSHVSERAANIGLDVNGKHFTAPDTESQKKNLVIKDQLSSYFNDKDKNLVYHLVTDLIVTTFLG